MYTAQYENGRPASLLREIPGDSFAPLKIALLPLLCITAALFMGDRALDKWMFSVINYDLPNLLPPVLRGVWDNTMVGLTTMGDAIILIWVYLLFNLLTWLRRGDYLLEGLKERCFVFTVVLILASLPVQGLKEYFLELRPSGVLLSDQLRILAPTPKDFSFPSGHTAGIFACVGALLPLIPKSWHLPAIAFAFCVGISRIAVGAHWPLDVSAGAFIGILTSMVSWKVAVWVHRKRLTGSKACAWLFQIVVFFGYLFTTVACFYSIFFLNEHRALVNGLVMISMLLALMIQAAHILILKRKPISISAIKAQAE